MRVCRTAEKVSVVIASELMVRFFEVDGEYSGREFFGRAKNFILMV
jgi:hypothetical protein